MALDDVVILNVDTNTLETPFDDLQSLPNDVVRSEWPRGQHTPVGKGRRVGSRGFPVARGSHFVSLFSLEPLSQ